MKPYRLFKELPVIMCKCVLCPCLQRTPQRETWAPVRLFIFSPNFTQEIIFFASSSQSLTAALHCVILPNLYAGVLVELCASCLIAIG